MRTHSTEAEEYFWQRVRNRKFHGLKFLRQHIIACPFDPWLMKFYIADFYCAEIVLIVELDGRIHDELYEQDLVRTDHLENKGFKVLRFSNEEVLHNWPYVSEMLESFQARSYITKLPVK